MRDAPAGVAKILPGLLDPQQRALVTAELFDLVDTAERSQGGLAGLLRSNPSALKFIHQHRQVRLYLPVQIAL